MQLCFGFMTDHEVHFLRKGAIISRPPLGKVRVPVPIFEARLRLTMTGFFNEILHQYGFNVDDLNPNVVNKFVGFELACRALSVLPNFGCSRLTSTHPHNLVFTPYLRGEASMRSSSTRMCLRRNYRTNSCGSIATWLVLVIPG